jgi:hypothetical protein
MFSQFFKHVETIEVTGNIDLTWKSLVNVLYSVCQELVSFDKFLHVALEIHSDMHATVYGEQSIRFSYVILKKWCVINVCKTSE